MPTPNDRSIAPAHRRLQFAAGVAAMLAAACWVVGSADAGPSPSRIVGDHHSPTVAARAAEALAAHDSFSATGTPSAFVAYRDARNATADAVAAELTIDLVALRDAWARADLQHQEALLAALTQLGVAYRTNTSQPGVGFDCSGLTAFAWGRAGIILPRQSSAQINAAEVRDETSAVAGDLMQYPGHVMMWLGVGDAIVHASNPETDVELSFTSRNVRYGRPTS
jgi:NlpC/P60 family